MAPAFLIGGGREDAQVRASHAPFVDACDSGPIVAFALEDPDRWVSSLRLAGARDVRCLSAPPAADDLGGAAGVFVGGGWTPAYQEALARWQPPDLPYAGFSAGAAVASARAIVGGWRLGERAICAEEAGEDLDQLEIRDGLGLVPFAVDVHATQWGTLTRLVHAVESGFVADGWAIDEGAVLIVDDGAVRVEGLGGAYRVAQQSGQVVVSVQP